MGKEYSQSRSVCSWVNSQNKERMIKLNTNEIHIHRLPAWQKYFKKSGS